VLQTIIRVFVEAFVSHDRHMLFALEESGPPRMTYTCESQLGTQPLIGPDIPLTALVGIAGRRRKILTYT
jgi:hypothetical protein